MTVVEVTDFDCPACRNAEPVIAAFRRDQPGIRFVRLVAPMPAHANARPAGRAFLAARAQGLGEEMAALLQTSDSRGPDRCRQLAARLGMDLNEYDRAVSDPSTDAELDANVAWARTAGNGLPLVWVQGTWIQGTPTYEALASALARAASRLRNLSPSRPIYIAGESSPSAGRGRYNHRALAIHPYHPPRIVMRTSLALVRCYSRPVGRHRNRLVRPRGHYPRPR